MSTVTWAQLTEIEPRLAILLAKALAIKDTSPAKPFCANRHWYGQGQLKEELCRLVGWKAQKPSPVLHTSAAYDIAYRKIYSALPDCRDCQCVPWG